MLVRSWDDKRIGTYRGLRKGKEDYGGTVFGEKGITVLGKYQGYNPLLIKICEFFSSGILPVPIEDTLEIYAFMQAAEESKIKGGISIDIEPMVQKAKNESKIK